MVELQNLIPYIKRAERILLHFTAQVFLCHMERLAC